MVSGIFARQRTMEIVEMPNGSERWAELHRRSRRPVANPALELEFIRWLASGLEGCSCNAHWREYLRQNPPDVMDVNTYWRWTVAAHNAVNRRLGKRVLSEEEAESLAGAFCGPLPA